MINRLKSIPEGYHSVTPSLIFNGNANKAIEFYQKAFGAELTFRKDRQDGKVMHATVTVGDSILMLSDECDKPHEGHESCPRSPESLKGTSVNLYLYVKNVDSVFTRALESGGRQFMPLQDMFWGDRIGMLTDPFGHFWTVATQKERLSPEQLKVRIKEYCGQNPSFC